MFMCLLACFLLGRPVPVGSSEMASCIFWVAGGHGKRESAVCELALAFNRGLLQGAPDRPRHSCRVSLLVSWAAAWDLKGGPEAGNRPKSNSKCFRSGLKPSQEVGRCPAHILEGF